MTQANLADERASRLFVVNLWLFDAFARAVDLFHAAREVETYFTQWRCAGRTVPDAAAFVASRSAEVRRSEKLLYLLNEEADSRYMPEYFEKYGIAWEDQPRLSFHGGGWVHWMRHFITRLERLAADLVEFGRSSKDFPDPVSARDAFRGMGFLPFGIRDGRFVESIESIPEYVRPYLDDIVGVDSEVEVLREMCRTINSFDAELRSMNTDVVGFALRAVLHDCDAAWPEGRFRPDHPLAHSARWEVPARAWTRLALASLPSGSAWAALESDRSAEIGSFEARCAAFDRKLAVSGLPLYFRCWPYRHRIWELVTS
jgi:hypothetical protein